jgi:hypothetical protein
VDAEIVGSILTRSSIPSEIADADRLPALDKPIALLDADPGPAGLEVQRTVDSPGTGLLPWSEIRIAAVGTVTFTPAQGSSMLTGDALGAGEFAEEERLGSDLLGLTFMFPAGAGHAGQSGYKMQMEPRKNPRPETVSCLDLVTTGATARYRIVAGRFVYDYLGDRMKLNSKDNFRSLIQDIAGYSPETLLSGSTLSFLDDPKARDHRFGSREEFESYVRWLVAWDAVFGE